MITPIGLWVNRHIFIQILNYNNIREPYDGDGVRMTISEELRNAILKSKLTRYAIAVGSGIDHAVLRRFMNGERDIKLRTADQLASFLGLELVKKRRSTSGR
jgi:hypothetical protein